MSEVTTAMEWRTIPVGDLRPAAYNPRKKLKAGLKKPRDLTGCCSRQPVKIKKRTTM